MCPEDFSNATFHQPNTKFPEKIAGKLGFRKEQIRFGLLSPYIGNTYAGASLLGLTDILDHAQPGERILIASFGSGAVSDAISFMVSEKIKGIAAKAPLTSNSLKRSIPVNYGQYARWRKKITLE